MSKDQWLFVAAAKGLQTYVFRSDPLKEMVGASELIESLPRSEGTGFLAKVLALADCSSDYEVLTDASGAARILFQSKADALLLARIWPLLAAQFAPGLEVSVTVVSVAENLGVAIEQAEREINVNRNVPVPAVPVAGPWVARNRRTGLPANYFADKPLDEEERMAGRPEAVDEESNRKRQAAEWTSLRTLLAKVVPNELHGLLASSTKEELEHFRKRWPLDVTKLATSDNSYVAIIHADANALGAALMACIEHLKTDHDAAKTYKALCGAIERASVAAARTALKGVIESTFAEETELARRRQRKILLPVPVRPLVCAGEDFTCIVRAEHAVAFAEDYLLALSEETKLEFEKLPERIPNLEPLSACAGIVFCKSHFPFSRAHALAESLCSFAKRRTERKVSGIAFLRLKSSLQPSNDYEAVVAHAFAAGDGGQRVRLTMNPYLVGADQNSGLPKLSDLRRLRKVLNDPALSRSGLRNLVSKAYESKTGADQAFERLRMIAKERDRSVRDQRKTWPPVEAALRSLTGNGLWKSIDGVHHTPLYDALELLHLQTRNSDEDSNDQY
jgi:hypothetical protein